MAAPPLDLGDARAASNFLVHRFACGASTSERAAILIAIAALGFTKLAAACAKHATGVVEVRARTAVKYSIDSVVVEGRLMLLDNDASGMFYRLIEAVPANLP